MVPQHEMTRLPGGRLVLVAEHDDATRQGLCTLLKEDYKLIQAKDGLAALDQLERHCADLSLVLLDSELARLDALEFLRRRSHEARYADVPVIVCASAASSADEASCLELGANDYVVKPCDPRVLVNRINNLVHLSESSSLVSQLTWDRVTGLLREEFFYRAVREAFADHPDASFDMVCSDIENFKAVNDRYGETHCDRVLRDLAERLGALLPEALCGGRVGGVSFAFLIPHQERGWQEALTGVTKDIRATNLGVNFGIVEQVDHQMPVSKICDRGISAAETMRDRHGIGVAFFDDRLHQRQLMEEVLRESMEEALAERQFVVCFQPKFDVRAGRPGGAEALVRWVHPELGFVRPDVFITLFERNGFITQLDLYVWEEACREVRRCLDLGLDAVPISVNASSLDFDLPDLAERVCRLADGFGIDHSLLHIELTETAYSDNPSMVEQTLRRLREMGFACELDDFGAGYSSLVSLNTLPLDAMKLDMSMIRKATELGDYRVIDSTIKLARLLGLYTVVEGVETAEQAGLVTDMGCDYIQGYYYAKPLSRDDFEAYLAQWH